MKKYLLFAVVAGMTFSSIAQQNYRLPDSLKTSKQYKLIGDEIMMNIIRLEYNLDNNSKSLKNLQPQFVKNPNIDNLFQGASQVNIDYAKKVICISCYQEEWKKQQSSINATLEKSNQVKDSSDQVWRDNKSKQMAFDDSVRRSTSTSTVSTSKMITPYDLLDVNITSTSDNKTVPFIGLDFNYSGNRFGLFLQGNMNMVSDKFDLTVNSISQKYKSGFGNESMTITYNITKRNDIVGYSESSTGDVAIINSIEIIGSYDLMIKLFIEYWDTNFKSADFKNNSIVERNYWGDKITLSWISSTQLKINIVKGISIDYESNYGIHQKRK